MAEAASAVAAVAFMAADFTVPASVAVAWRSAAAVTARRTSIAAADIVTVAPTVIAMAASASPTTGIFASVTTSTAGSTTRRPIITIITAAAGSSGPITGRARSVAIGRGIATTITGELSSQTLETKQAPARAPVIHL